VTAYVRAALSAFYISMRLRFISGFAVMGLAVFPLIFAAVGLFVLNRPGTSPTQWTYGVLGGGLIGYWGITYLDAGNSIQIERWNGTLEPLFGVPTPLWVIVLGKVCGGLVWGMLSFIPTVGLAYFGFHAILPDVDPLKFVVSFAVLTFSFLAVALSLTPVFALWRWAFSLINGFELGTYVFCGFMFPVTILPAWAQAVSALLAPTWATRALYASTTTEGPHDFTSWWALSILLSVLYVALSLFLYRTVERRARVTGDLALV
jgi:ABC-2 type transport system permease protein